MNRQSGPLSAIGVLLIVLGILLLLPGLCSLASAIQIGATDNLIRLATNDPYFQIVLTLWGVCLIPTAGGVLLIRYALRRRRREPDIDDGGR